MKVQFTHTLTAIALAGTALFSTAAQADRGYVTIGFGAAVPGFHHYSPPGGQYRPEYGRPDFRPGPDRVSSFIDTRQDRQMDHIRNGIRNGELTPREAHALMQEQREIAWLEQRFLADGRLNRYERRRLDEELDEAGHNIRAEIRDGEDRGDYRTYHGGRWR
jgi:hypothetical protein